MKTEIVVLESAESGVHVSVRRWSSDNDYLANIYIQPEILGSFIDTLRRINKGSNISAVLRQPQNKETKLLVKSHKKAAKKLQAVK